MSDVRRDHPLAKRHLDAARAAHAVFKTHGPYLDEVEFLAQLPELDGPVTPASHGLAFKYYQRLADRFQKQFDDFLVIKSADPMVEVVGSVATYHNGLRNEVSYGKPTRPFGLLSVLAVVLGGVIIWLVVG